MADTGPPAGPTAVALVGGGPGEPGLLTVRARELLDRCDVVVYDARVPKALLPPPRSTTLPERMQLPPDATPEKAGRLLARLAREGRRVVRLYHGDPFLFGAGSAEAQALFESAVPFEVVAGVPPEVAAPAAAGVPVAHPGLASAVTFATARADERAAPADWAALARTGGTIVVRGDAAGIARARDGLLAGGLLEDVPAALVRDGATPRQEVTVGTLQSIAGEAGAGESVAVFGWPVVLRDELAWLERRPLHGRTVAVTRPEGDQALAARLREMGADVLAVPATRVEPLALDRLVEALGALDEYGFVVFTSRHAVRIVWETLRHLRRDARAFAGVVVCAVGSATAEALAERGVLADVVPASFQAEGLVEALAARDDVRGARVLYPAADGAREVIPDGLAALGADVDVVRVYRSVPAGPGSEGARALTSALNRRQLDVVTFTAPSTVRAFVEMVGADVATNARAVTIGGVTTEAARALGFDVAAEASPSTSEGLATAVARLFEEAE